MRRRPEFSLVVRHGKRAARGSVVAHVLPPSSTSSSAPRVGLVVTRQVGNAVVRNQVRRRLRHLMRDRLPALPAGGMLVLRATPAAGRQSSAELAADLDSALGRVTR